MMTDILRTNALQHASDLVYPHRRRAWLPADSARLGRMLRGLVLVACFAAIVSLGCDFASAADYSAGGGVVNAPSGFATAVCRGASNPRTSHAALGPHPTELG